MRRILALLAAAAMVAASFAVRSALDDTEGGGGAPDGDASGREVARIVCDPSLAEVCEAVGETAALDVSVEPLAESIDRLGGERLAQPEVWVTAAPAVAIVEEARERAGLPAATGAADPLAHTQLGLVIWAERAERLSTCAGGEAGWACLAEAAGQRWTEVGGDETWGIVKPGHASPDETALGLVALGQVAAGLLGRADLSAADLDDPAFAGPFRRLARAAPSFPGAVDELVDTLAVQGPASFDAVALPAPAARRLAELTGSRFAGLVATYAPGGMASSVEVVAVPVPEGAEVSDDLARALTDALVDAGWDAGPVDDDGLPAPGVLEALRLRWREVTR